MQLRIRHVTCYRYDKPIDYAVQLVRLTPLNHAGQRVLNWRVVDAGGKPLAATTDGYGNVVHMMSVHRRHEEAKITAEGLVETAETHGMLREADERLPRAFYNRTTRLTRADEALRALATEVSSSIDAIEQLHRLMLTVHRRVKYVVGTTTVTTTAAEALARGSGVCQDHAHIFLTCARLLGHPARYVSGYLWEGQQDEPLDAGHAWAEAYVDLVGWIGFDAANGIAPAENYVRTAIGLDYREAAPFRGVWRGAASETLAVRLEVQQVQSQQ
jgi:transglutaminase-like putative cysteine protease